MKRYIKQILTFSVILLVAILAIQYTLDSVYKKRVTNKFTQVLRHKTDAEIMIFGSSVVYHQFDPRIINEITGKTCYNMGWPGMFFAQYEGVVKEYLRYGQDCKFIVIGCDFDNLGKNELITRPDIFYAYLGNSNIYNALYSIEPRKMLLAKYLPGYKLTLLKKAFYLDMAMGTPISDTAGGFEAINSSWEVSHKNPFNARYNADVYDRLTATVAEITKRGIKTILVIPPAYEEGYKLIKNAEDIKARYRALANNKDVYFIDYTGDGICKTKSYFRNFTHLNAAGAALFSHTFAQDLLKIIHE